MIRAMTDAARQPAPADGIKTIQYSLKCFELSFGGLIPFVGIPFMLKSFSCFWEARATARGCWNPAKKYLLWGRIIASIGFLLNIMVVLWVICAWLQILPWQYED